MTKYDGSIPVTGTITTTDTEDAYATHIDDLGKGGYRVVATAADRDAISADRRTEGMLVYVLDESVMYQLIGGVDNINWVQPNFDTLSDLTENYIFVGNAQGKAEESTALIDIELDLIEVNESLDELQASSPLLKNSSTAFPEAQIISDMQPGFLFHANAGNLVSLAVLTNDHLPELSEGHIRIGNSSNRPEQILYEVNTIPVNGNIDLNGFKAINSDFPTNDNELSNKEYVDTAINNQPAAYMGVYNFNDNLNLVAGQTRLTNDLPYTFFSGSRWFDMPISGRLLAQHTGDYNYIVRVMMQVRNTDNSDFDFQLEILKNGVNNIVRPSFVRRLVRNEWSNFSIETEPVNLRGGMDYVELALKSSITTGLLNIRDLSFYVIKF